MICPVGADLESVLEEGDELVVIQRLGPNEAVLFGSDDALDAISLQSEPIASNITRAARQVTASAPEFQTAGKAVSGKWVKLTQEAAEALAQHGGTSAPGGGIYGVVHNKGGIAKHLTFVNAGRVSQLAATLPSLGAAVAMQLQLAAIEKKLDLIKEDLDYVIDHIHDKTLADQRADLRVLSEVYEAVQLHGELDDDQWALARQRQGSVYSLYSLTSRRLRSFTEVISNPQSGVGKRAKELNTALRRDRVLFWLEAHVHAEIALMRWQALYLIREAEQHPETLDRQIATLEAEREERNRLLQNLADDIAIYLVDDGHLQSLLQKIRIISRRRLRKLLSELGDVLNAYSDALRHVGLGQHALPPARPPIALPSGEPDEAERRFRDLLAQLGNAPRVAARVSRRASDLPDRIREKVRRSNQGEPEAPTGS